MKRSQKKTVLIFALSISLAIVFILLGPLGMITTVQAAPDMILIAFTDTSPTQYTDLLPNVIGTGLHVGELRCVGDICTQKIVFEPVTLLAASDTVVYEYKFKSLQVYDPLEGRLIVSGTGTIISNGPKTRFSFTGTFFDNRNGTVRVTYEASTPEASFIFPAASCSICLVSEQ
jgi:hypothetical protein